ncbi:UDP-N-acetyl glucosamine 2-epimerase [Aneurinibacillus danicus]|uniref:UDP-N-acetylglucosamine 2-epimerase (non-hydrolyzing) n=2 Tax=Aneurinibacillus group TaxID=85151 RepID=A0A511V6B2_9BACL|nr:MULTISPECIES: UDP-N-acetylglucosamine 2-epimerase (non-hydrolyzing) [Aneurinibacillus]GEN34450.1 UDP-N-acetyl glucosamine 2-epimerase [Aneurinibacillus danicus]
MTRRKIMTVFGTRPEAIKMAPLVHKLRQYEELEPFVCVTAQHRQMLDQVLDIFSVTPDADLNVMKDRQTLTQITTRVLEGLDEIMKAEKPDMVLVHGDTTTTFAASLAAFYNQIPVGHVEAGLRTWNKYSPYPEEMNRQLTGVISDLHFAPTAQAAENLKREDKRDDVIYVTGNTVIDALKTTVRDDYKHPVLEEFAGKKLILVTAHRRENLGEPMARMFRAIRRLVDKHEDIAVVYPVHLNPVVQEAANKYLGEHGRIQLIAPLGAVDFHNFMSRAYLILTDSGGVQEEAPAFGVPVLVLRDTTERPEGIEAGTLKLAGTDEEKIFTLADELLTSREAYDQMAKAVNPYGDGEASRRICEAILYYFGLRGEKPVPFLPKSLQR